MLSIEEWPLLYRGLLNLMETEETTPCRQGYHRM